jgi:hypothetical protein
MKKVKACQTKNKQCTVKKTKKMKEKKELWTQINTRVMEEWIL